MSKAREIREAIKKIVGDYPDGIFTAQVLSSTETDCEIQFGDTKITGVRLFSSDEGKLLIKPVKNSMVTVADLSGGNFRDLEIIKVDKAELIRFEHEGLMFEMDGTSKKFDISTNGANLKDILASLATILKSLKVAVLAPNAPSGTITPDTLTLVEKFEMDVKTLLK